VCLIFFSKAVFMRKRFSLQFLFKLTTSLAILCGVAVVMPDWFSQLVIGAVWIVAAGILITGLVFAKGDQRAFCIGATVALSSMWMGPGGRFMAGIHKLINSVPGLSLAQSVLLWIDFLVHVLLAWSLGMLCIRAKEYFESDIGAPIE
jgi:hypothetical protein